MSERAFTYESKVDGTKVYAYAWEVPSPKALVVISHGHAEHALRYRRFAAALNEAGYDAWAMDHRGHGATSGPNGLGDFGEGGWDGLVADIHQMVAQAHEERPGLKVVLFGHSMGAAAAQQFTPDGSHTIDALILSGSTAREVPKPGEKPANVLTSINAPFEPARTAYDWLSRDEAEVDKYIADPLSGSDKWSPENRNRPNRADPFRLANPDVLKQIRADLPVLFVAGDADPINNNLKGLELLESRWREAGVQRIDTQFYPGGRHEMLNETNRDEVTAAIVGWLDGVVG